MKGQWQRWGQDADRSVTGHGAEAGGDRRAAGNIGRVSMQMGAQAALSHGTLRGRRRGSKRAWGGRGAPTLGGGGSRHPAPSRRIPTKSPSSSDKPGSQAHCGSTASGVSLDIVTTLGLLSHDCTASRDPVCVTPLHGGVWSMSIRLGAVRGPGGKNQSRGVPPPSLSSSQEGWCAHAQLRRVLTSEHLSLCMPLWCFLNI